MEIIANVGAALQHLFGESAAAAAQTSGGIVRQRKFTAVSLARTFVLGFLRNPQASDEELARLPQEQADRRRRKLMRMGLRRPRPPYMEPTHAAQARVSRPCHSWAMSRISRAQSKAMLFSGKRLRSSK